MSSSIYLYIGVGVAAVVAIVIAVVLTKRRRRQTQGDDELLSEMATHFWNLPPLTPPEEGAPFDLQKVKVPSPEQVVGPNGVWPGGERRSPLQSVTKLKSAAATDPEAAQSKADIASVAPYEGPKPAPVEYQEPLQGPRRMGRHHLMWEVVDAGIDSPGVWPLGSEAAERPVEQMRQPAPHAGREKPNAIALEELQTQGHANELVEGRHPSLESVSESRGAEQGRWKEQLDVAASGLVEQTRGRLRSEVAAALETFSREVDARLHALEQEPSIAKLRAEIAAQLQKQLGDVRDAAGEAHQKLRQCGDAAVEKINLAVETAAGTFEHQTKVRLGEVEDALRKTSDDLMASAAGRFEEQAVTIGERVTEELRTRQAGLMDEVDKQIGAAIQSPLESLNSKAPALTEECRRLLRQELDEGVRKGVQELETDSRKFLEHQRESVQSLFDKRLATTIQEARESLKREAQAIMAECRSWLLQDADAAAASPPKREAEREKLPMKPHEPGVRPMELYLAGSGELRREWTRLHKRPTAFLHATLRAAVWLIPVAPILVFVILSTRSVTHLRADPPAEFFEASPDSKVTQRAAEERLARAYWDSAVQYVQPKYEFGTKLPLEPVPEFKAEGVGARGGNSKGDSDSQRRYWRRLRQVWVQPQAWEKSYVWDTGWIDGALANLRRTGTQVVEGAR